MTTHMKYFRIAGNCVLLFSSVLALGCAAESATVRAERMQTMLSEAGFKMVAADTPAKAQRLAEMTPLKMSYISRNSKYSYWVADPYNCRCLYVGNEQNYVQYELLKHCQYDDTTTPEVEQRSYAEYMSSPAGTIFNGD